MQTDTPASSKQMRPPDIVMAPDETVFGIAARQHRLSGNRSSSDSLRELFGSDRMLPGSLLPGHLEHLFDHLGIVGASYSAIVDRHTALPYWRPFVGVDRYRDVQTSMWRTSASGLKLALGVISSRLGGTSALRYCDACVEADLARLGVPTWHRIHQLPGVLICPTHALALHETDHLAQQIHRHTLFLPDERLVAFKRPAHNLAKADKARLFRLAALSAELLDLPAEIATHRPSLRAHYLARLTQYDLVTSRQRVRITELQRHVTDYWAPISGIEPFASLFASISCEHNWLAGLVRKRRGTRHPLKHLLLIGAIASSVEECLYQDVPAKTSPATVSSRPTARDDSSLVSQAIHLMKDEGHSARHVARELGIDVHTALTIAHRNGIGVARRSKRIFASQREEVRQLLGAGHALTEIAHKLSISMSAICRILAADPDLQRARRELQRLRRRDEARNGLLEVLRQQPSLSPSKLRQRTPSCYMWLYRNDRAWLDERLLDMPRGRKVQKSCVDWAGRDVSLANTIRSTAQAIRTSEAAPVRITLRELGRRTGRTSWLEKHRDKLPICNILLQDVLETISDFQARRLEWWNCHLTIEEGVPPSPFRIWRLAGIPSRRRASGADSHDQP